MAGQTAGETRWAEILVYFERKHDALIAHTDFNEVIRLVPTVSRAAYPHLDPVIRNRCGVEGINS
jgi:hypothetical protein